MDFKDFAQLVYLRVSALTKGPVFEVALSGDELWAHYLASFPEGSNPIFRQRTEHDCSCCRSFIKGVAGMVAISPNGQLQTIWDVAAEGPYAVVAAALAAKVRSAPIRSVFRTRESGYGKETTVEAREGLAPINWNHFHCRIPSSLVSNEVGAAKGEADATYQVFSRGLKEITLDAIATLIDLFEQNQVYRGQDFLPVVRQFQAHQLAAPADHALYCWANLHSPAARFRNTAVGTFAQELSEGMAVDAATARFEAMVAPTNYRRSSAPITSGMVKSTVAALKEMGLDGAVRRRMASISDIPVKEVLFVDRTSRALMRGGLEDLLLKKVVQKSPKDSSNITGEVFLQEVLPWAESIKVLVSNQHLGKFMTLTAPEQEGGPKLFSWENNLAWVYDGNVTDSITQRVKNAGGNINALLRVSLAWGNTDDLDIHAQTPNQHIYFGNKAGVLDVDMNAWDTTTNPVENLAWTSLAQGTYSIHVNQYNARNPKLDGFDIEYEYNGEVLRYTYPGTLKRGQSQQVVTFNVNSMGKVADVQFDKALRQGPSTKSHEKWGVQTEQFVPVKTVMLSPNHWGGESKGAKHYLFILDGCVNPNPVRGFFNEYLRPELNQHRKVLEVLADQTLVASTQDQLSGLGFSSTRKDQVTFEVVRGRETRTYNVQF